MATLEKEKEKASQINKQNNKDDNKKSNNGLNINLDKYKIEDRQDDEKSQISLFFTNVFETVSIFVFNYLRSIGVETRKKIKKTNKRFNRFYNKFINYHVNKSIHSAFKCLKYVKKGLKFFFTKILLFLKFFADAFNVVKKGYQSKKSKGFLKGLGGAFTAFFKGVKNNKFVFVTIKNYSLPIIAIAIFGFVIHYVTNLNFAVSVEYNGEHIGYIENEAVFERAETKLQQRMTYVVDDEIIDNIPKFELKVVPKTEIKDDLEITDAIIKSSSQDIVKATGLNIDGVFYGAVKDPEQIQASLDAKLEKYNNTNGTVKFTKDVSLEPGLFVAKNIKDTQEIKDLINKEEDKDVFDEIKEGDTPIKIAARNNISVDQLAKYNPKIIENCLVGKQVLVNKSQPFLPVSVVREIEYEEVIPFETEITESSKLYKGMTKETKEGKNGKKIVTASVEEVDGIEVKRTILSTKTITYPVTRKVTRGTGVFTTPASSTPYNGPKSNYGFIWPVSGSYISSPYGYRGRSFHTGIDCAFRGNGYGVPIYAAASGRVIYARGGGSYGNLVKIDHGNGVQTWYAHSSKILVREGQIVSQGQQIAKVGSTGRSTGNHLHFEVRINGATQNPRRYLP